MTSKIRKLRRALPPERHGASDRTLMRRVTYGGRKGRVAKRRLALVEKARQRFVNQFGRPPVDITAPLT